MLQILITLKCDDCGGFFEELRSSQKPDLDEWALSAGNLNETAGLAGWFFNPKTSKHWCIDCVDVMQLKGLRNEAQMCSWAGPIFNEVI